MSESVNSCIFNQFEMHATRRILTRRASMSNIPAAAANINFGQTSQSSNAPIPPPMPTHTGGQSQPPPSPQQRPRAQTHHQQQHHHHQRQAHFQMHQHHQQQLYMERMRGGVQTSNDYYFSEMHSTWQYSNLASPYYAHIPPTQSAGAANMPIIPNLNVPPPPYGVYPINNASSMYAAGYAAAYQANAGYLGPNHTMLNNSAGAMGGSMSSFSGTAGVGTGAAPSTNSSGASTSTSNNDTTTTSSSSSSFSSSSGSTSQPSTPSSAASATPFNDSVAHKPKSADASTQVNFYENPNESSESSSSNSTPIYGAFKDLLVLNTSSANSSILGAGDANRSDDSALLHPKDKSVRKTGEVELSQEKLNSVTSMCLSGSEMAEKVAYVHRNRPCFKKIDSLCARMKQDLIRPDGVMPNINSQGIAWAVKDFIFVFTRIVNAWIIMRGYIYNTPDGLNKIKSVLPDIFTACFIAWQDATVIFVEQLIKSFVALDNLVHKQKSSFNNSESAHCNGHCNAKATGNTTTIPNEKTFPTKSAQNDIKEKSIEKPASAATADSLKKNYMYTMVEDSEATQRNVNANGTYLKTGTYRPLQLEEEKSANEAKKKMPTNTSIEVGATGGGLTNSSSTVTLKAAASATAVNNAEETTAAINAEDATPANNADEATAGASTSKTRLDELFEMPDSNVVYKESEEDLIERALLGPPRWATCDNIRRPRLDPTSIFGRDIIESLSEFGDRLLALKNAKMFFKKDFMKTYFADFMAKCKFDFVDVHHIILKCQNAQYNHLYEAVHDVRHISYVVKGYLQLYDDYALNAAITKFDSEVNEMLNKHPYIKHQFDHIVGSPNEKLFNYNI